MIWPRRFWCQLRCLQEPLRVVQIGHSSVCQRENTNRKNLVIRSRFHLLMAPNQSINRMLSKLLIWFCSFHHLMKFIIIVTPYKLFGLKIFTIVSHLATRNCFVYFQLKLRYRFEFVSLSNWFLWYFERILLASNCNFYFEKWPVSFMKLSSSNRVHCESVFSTSSHACDCAVLVFIKYK